MSSMGYLAFAVSVINSVVNAANNINNNDNNNNNNNNDNNNNNNNVNIQNSNNNQNNMNMLIAGRKLPVERLLELQERLARHHQVKIDVGQYIISANRSLNPDLMWIMGKTG